MLPRGFNGVGVTVAMNQAQYEGSCGKCIKVRFCGGEGMETAAAFLGLSSRVSRRGTFPPCLHHALNPN